MIELRNGDAVVRFVPPKRNVRNQGRLAYHRKRMRVIGRRVRDGVARTAPVLVRGADGKLCSVSGQMRSDVTGGWVNVLDCDVANPDGGSDE